MASEEPLGTPSSQEADLPHADPPAHSNEQNCSGQAVESSALGNSDPTVTVHQNGPKPLAELCQDKVKQGDDVQASQLQDDLCSTLLNGSLFDATLSDTTVPPGSESTGGNEQQNRTSKPPETSTQEEPSSQWIDVLGNGQLMKKVR